MYANSLVKRWLPVATLVVLAGWIGTSLAQEKKTEPPKPKTIVDVAKDSAKTFHKLLESTDLAKTLAGKGPYTVFAPTDEAFTKLGKELDELQKPENKAKLERLLKHHIIEGAKKAEALKAMKTAKTLALADVQIVAKDKDITIDKAKITKADIEASNGVIHLVDTVLQPPPAAPAPAAAEE